MIASSIWWATRSGRSRRTRTVGQNLFAGDVLPPSATALAGIIGRKTRAFLVKVRSPPTPLPVGEARS